MTSIFTNTNKKEISQYEKMTQTPVEKLVTVLAIPTILSMLITNIYNMADTAFVGRLGTSPSGAVGIVFGFMSILQAIGFMFGQGSGAIASRCLGQKENAKANTIATTGLFYSIFFGILVSILSAIFLDPLVKFLGSTDTIAPYAKTYITYILFAAPLMTASFTMNNLLRFQGKAIYGMAGLMTGAILNIIMDPILMFKFDLGIAGAGLSTAISQTIGTIILFTAFLLPGSQIKLDYHNISLKPALLSDIAATGLPSMIRQGLMSISTVLLNSLCSAYGDAAISAMSIVSRISFFTFSLSLGIGQGFQPVSSYNYGAGKYSRLRKAYKFGFIISQISMTILVTGVLLYSSNIISLFRNDVQVIAIGTRAVRIQALAQLFMPFSVMTEMQLQSTGQKWQASILSSMKSGTILIPALIILSRIRGLYGIQEAQPLSLILATLPSIYFALSFFNRLPKEDKED